MKWKIFLYQVKMTIALSFILFFLKKTNRVDPFTIGRDNHMYIRILFPVVLLFQLDSGIPPGGLRKASRKNGEPSDKWLDHDIQHFPCVICSFFFGPAVSEIYKNRRTPPKSNQNETKEKKLLLLLLSTQKKTPNFSFNISVYFWLGTFGVPEESSGYGEKGTAFFFF